MTLSMKEIDAKISKQEKEREQAQNKIISLDENCKAKKTALDEKCKADKKPYEEKIKFAEKELTKLQTLKTKFEKLQAEFFGTE